MLKFSDALFRGRQLLGERGRIGVEFANAFAVGNRPGGDASVKIGGKNPRVIMVEGHAQRQIAEEIEGAHLAAVGIPESDLIIAAAGDEPAIMREIYPERAAAMRVPALGLLAVLRFPPLHPPIFAARSEDLRVAAPAQR